MTDTKELKPAAYMYERFMYDYMSGWEKNITTLDPREMQWVRPEDLRDVEPLYSAEALERLEREREEARKECDKLSSAWAANLSSKSETVTTLRARLAKMEEALKAFGFGGDAAQERIGWRGVYPVPSTNAHFRCEFCLEEYEDSGKIQHQETCPISIARAALTEEQP